MKIKSLLLLATSCIMFACTPKEKEITVNNVEISGFIKDYVKVVDGPYTITTSDGRSFITIKFELTNKPEQPVCRRKHPDNIRLNVIDAKGTIFNTGIYGFEAEREETAKLKALINNGKIGDTKSISFCWRYFDQGKDVGKRIMKEASSFEIIDEAFGNVDIIDEDKIHWDDETEAGISANSPKSGASNYDKVLDKYEKYVDEYIKFYKKAMNGDASAMSEYAKLLEKAEALSNELDNAKDDLTAAQAGRYLKITEKMTKAMLK